MGYLAFVVMYENEYKVHLQPVLSIVYQKGHILIFHAKKEKFDPFGPDYEEFFIPLYPVIIIIMSIPSFFILKKLTLWKLQKIQKHPFDSILSKLDKWDEEGVKLTRGRSLGRSPSSSKNYFSNDSIKIKDETLMKDVGGGVELSMIDEVENSHIDPFSGRQSEAGLIRK